MFKWLDRKLNLKLRNWSIWECLLCGLFASYIQIDLLKEVVFLKEINILLTDLRPKRFSHQKTVFSYKGRHFLVYFDDEKKSKIPLLQQGLDDVLKDEPNIIWENYQFDFILAPFHYGKRGGHIYLPNAGFLYRIIAPNGYAILINQEVGSFRLRIFIQRLSFCLIFLSAFIFNLCAFYRIRFILRRNQLEALERQANRKRLNQALQNKNK